ncbi:hypothetical protein [uncultured Parasphingopyxis sp.]|uniref:hypothetical protein n=1 Tax=uncultured Parasphingopyxis sp. TaxID=1547918 RepID=UPI0026151E51|nr:hypothetical protein [uncultured Parasphingopyxis sp.]
MKNLVALCGFEAQVVNEIRRRSSKRFAGKNSFPLIILENEDPYAYSEKYISNVHSQMCRKISGHKILDKIRILAVFVDYRNADTERLVKSFFPFAMLAPVRYFDPVSNAKFEERRKLVEYVNMLETSTNRGLKKCGQVEDYFAGKRFCNLFLPIRNFRSKVLCDIIDRIQSDAANSNDIYDLLQKGDKELNSAYPRLKDQGKPSVKDERRLIFSSPGNDRHGMADRLVKPHNPICLLSARARFGGGLDPLFHFDCTPERGGLPDTFPNCHDRPTRPKSEKHVNIAANDYVR